MSALHRKEKLTNLTKIAADLFAIWEGIISYSFALAFCLDKKLFCFEAVHIDLQMSLLLICKLEMSIFHLIEELLIKIEPTKVDYLLC